MEVTGKTISIRNNETFYKDFWQTWMLDNTVLLDLLLIVKAAIDMCMHASTVILRILVDLVAVHTMKQTFMHDINP